LKGYTVLGSKERRLGISNVSLPSGRYPLKWGAVRSFVY